MIVMIRPVPPDLPKNHFTVYGKTKSRDHKTPAFIPSLEFLLNIVSVPVNIQGCRCSIHLKLKVTHPYLAHVSRTNS